MKESLHQPRRELDLARDVFAKCLDYDRETGLFFWAGKPIHLGCFDTAEEAHAAYIAAKRVLHGGCTV